MSVCVSVVPVIRGSLMSRKTHKNKTKERKNKKQQKQQQPTEIVLSVDVTS